jgi:hypothetical protein
MLMNETAIHATRIPTFFPISSFVSKMIWRSVRSLEGRTTTYSLDDLARVEEWHCHAVSVDLRLELMRHHRHPAISYSSTVTTSPTYETLEMIHAIMKNGTKGGGKMVTANSMAMPTAAMLR